MSENSEKKLGPKLGPNPERKLGPNARRKREYWTHLNDAKQAKQENNRRARQKLEEGHLKDLDEKMIATGSKLGGKMVIQIISDPTTKNITRFFLMRVE